MDDRSFEAEQCTVTVPHRELACLTPAGPVGSIIQWTVVVDGLSSLLPATSTERPRVTSAEGTDVTTEGGDLLTISGSGFGVESSRITALTYGPTGAEYTATNCAITVPNHEMSCRSAPGVGRDLPARVLIADQLSPPSAAGGSRISYAPPLIESIAPSITTEGGRLTIVGSEFAWGCVFGLPGRGVGRSRRMVARGAYWRPTGPVFL